MKDKLIQFFLLGCGSLEEAEKELDRSVREVQKKTGFNEKLSLQKIAEEIGLWTSGRKRGNITKSLSPAGQK